MVSLGFIVVNNLVWVVICLLIEYSSILYVVRKIDDMASKCVTTIEELSEYTSEKVNKSFADLDRSDKRSDNKEKGKLKR